MENEELILCEMKTNGKNECTTAKIYIDPAIDKNCDDSEDDASSNSTLENSDFEFLSPKTENFDRNKLDPSFDKLLDENVVESFYEDNQNVRHRILTPILEENEDVQSIISSLPQQCDAEDQSERSFFVNRNNMSLHSSSFDSLASFEANEFRLMALEGASPWKEVKTSETKKLKPRGKKIMDEEKDILNYALRRQSDSSSCSPINNPITSHTFYLSSLNDNTQKKPNIAEPEFISEAKSPTSYLSESSKSSMEQNLNEDEEMSVGAHENTKTDFVSAVENCDEPKYKSSQRCLSLDTLKRNIASNQVDTVHTNYIAEDDPLSAFEDRVVGYFNQRQREDSIFDLTSLHNLVVSEASNLQVPQVDICNRDLVSTRKESEQIHNHLHSCESPSMQYSIKKRNTDCDASNASDSQDNSAEADVVGKLNNCLSLREIEGATTMRSNQNVESEATSQSRPAVCIFNDDAIDIVSSFESEFHSCISSTSTNKDYELPQLSLTVDEVSSDPAYLTPLEDTVEQESEFKTISDDSGTAVLSSTKSMWLPLATTVTSGATGYQTPPKYYYVIPPKIFGSKVEEKSVPRGGTAVLDCSIVSHPEAKVAWYKDGRLLEIYDRISQHTSNRVPSECFEDFSDTSWEPPPLLPTEVDLDIGCVSQLDVHYLLKIKNAMTKDEGSYVCKAWNAAGVATRTIRLTVSNYYT